MTHLNLNRITPNHAAELMRKGAILIDIREGDEHGREHIPGASNAPLSTFPDTLPETSGLSAVIFHCKSGMRTAANAARLAAAAQCEAYLVEGGLEAWKTAGLPVAADKGQPLEMQRQVQIAAGSLVVIGALLGAFVAPGFIALSGVVGAGLALAGATGTCGMARALKLMPWNRRQTA